MWRLCEKSMDTSRVCSNDIEINQQFRRLLAPVQLLDSLIGGFELEVIAIAISLLFFFFYKTKCVAECHDRHTFH